MLGAFRLDIKRVHMDMVENCAVLRVLSTSNGHDVDWAAVAPGVRARDHSTL